MSAAERNEEQAEHPATKDAPSRGDGVPKTNAADATPTSDHPTDHAEESAPDGESESTEEARKPTDEAGSSGASKSPHTGVPSIKPWSPPPPAEQHDTAETTDTAAEATPDAAHAEVKPFVANGPSDEESPTADAGADARRAQDSQAAPGVRADRANEAARRDLVPVDPDHAGLIAADPASDSSGSDSHQPVGHGAAQAGGAEPTSARTHASTAPQTGAGGSARPGSMTQLESLVSRGLSASLAQRGGTLTMRLMPDSLGAMRIQMDVQQGVVQVSMDVANSQAHRLLTESLDTLRASLEARGLTVEKLGVSLTPSVHAGATPLGAGANAGGSSSPGTGDPNAQGQDANGQFSQHDAGDGRSRSWLGGDQRNQERPGGAGPHASIGTGTKEESFGDLWQRLRMGIDTRV